ncbi:helix-turn-helix domain-containing protein [Actinomadura xylanilytica]|uniref:helix-turn-helix domain-containing protein n=1 Tax=Actinomadura xylanilytica TaxID=887459 RepID=UPI00255AE870|nr:helix-turn-helix transcriptional regulator [Actinomadura xylanilytica]MDL4772555.1 helix-turn-helix transcriptional regulator [Actinomadura xylanilytica]
MNLAERLQSVRKRRGLTQKDLAFHSGVSLSLIRKLEQGEREDTRLETLRKLAKSLQVSTSDLIIRPEPGEITSGEWESIRDALLGLNGRPDEMPTAAGVAGAVEAAEVLFTDNRFDELGELLPALLRDVLALGDGERQLRSRGVHLAAHLLIMARQFAAAEIALRRALDDAPGRFEEAAIINTRCWLLMRQGDLAGTLDLAVRWADEVEPRVSRATPEELATWGGLLLRVSTAASRNNEPGESADALRFAQAAAVALRIEWAPPSDPLREFGPVAVATRRAENYMIEDRPDRVLELAAKIPRSGFRARASSRNRHRLDVAKANMRLHRYADSFEILKEVRVTSPEWIDKQPMARDILGQIVAKRRTLTSDMRELADFIHLEY